MQSAAPRPPGDGAVMWWASQVDAAPSTSPYTVAPRASGRAALLEQQHRRALRDAEPVAPVSKGRDRPLRDSAVMVVNPATVVGVIDDSAPPASTASQRPSKTIRAPAATEWVPAAQAVVRVSHGPRQPCRSATAAAPALGMTIGMVKGETRPGPRAASTPTCVSRVPTPPMPVPSCTPARAGSTSGAPPAWSSAISAAATAKWVKRSWWRASLPDSQGEGSKSSTRRSRAVGGAVRSPCQNASSPVPAGDTTPMPVTTTRRGVAAALTRAPPADGAAAPRRRRTSG